MEKERILQKLSEELSSPSIYTDYISQIEELRGESIRIGVLGQSNTGKTTLINSLLETKLPVSNLPSNLSYHIKYCDNETTNTVDSLEIIGIKNEWLRNKRIEVLEINADIIPDETTQIELCKIISKVDLCIYLTNAQSALNRTDIFVLDNLNSVGIQTVVVLSRMDLIASDDQSSIISYLKSNLKDFEKISVLPSSKCIVDSKEEILLAAENLITKANTAVSRDNFSNFYLGIAISKLFEICNGHIEDCNTKAESIEKAAENKISELNTKSTDWLKVETQLRIKTSEITDKLRERLSVRKEDIIRRLHHDVDVCGDVKLFWEKDFPFRLEEIMRSELNASTQMVNAELVRAMQWLQDTLMKQFRCKMSLTTAVVGDRTSIKGDGNSNIEIADTQKLKIVTRIGTAATVIAAGTLLASAGIGGVIMAVSMVSGIGAEFFMRKQSNDSKEKIKKAIPEIVDRAQIQLISDFNQKIDDVTNEIISQLQTVKLDWIEQREKTIEQEKSIALFNNNSAKWDSIMQRINQLAELILK